MRKAGGPGTGRCPIFRSGSATERGEVRGAAGLKTCATVCAARQRSMEQGAGHISIPWFDIEAVDDDFGMLAGRIAEDMTDSAGLIFAGDFVIGAKSHCPAQIDVART